MKYKQVKLSDIAEITMGQSPKSEYYNSNKQGLPFLQGVRTFGDNYPFFDTYTTSYNKTAIKNDILFSVRAPVGRVNLAMNKIAIGRGVASIRTKSGYSRNYLYYYLKKIGNQLDLLATGTVFTSINKTELQDLDILIPESLQDQEKISNRLALLDEKIELNNQINDNLYELLDYKYEEFIQKSKLFQTTLGNISKLTSGGDKPKEISNTRTEKYNVPIYSNGTKNEGLYGFTTTPKIIHEAVTISSRGTIGYSVLRNSPYVPIVRLISAQSTGSVPIEFLYLLIKHLHIQGYGSTQQQITIPYMKKYPIKIPTFEVINTFNSQTKVLFQKINNGKKENEILNNLKNTLLNKYF